LFRASWAHLITWLLDAFAELGAAVSDVAITLLATRAGLGRKLVSGRGYESCDACCVALTREDPELRKLR